MLTGNQRPVKQRFIEKREYQLMCFTVVDVAMLLISPSVQFVSSGDALALYQTRV